MAQQIQLRRGSAAQWSSLNPVLAQGEPGVETDTGKFKIGDGSTAWTSLGYASGATPPDAGTGTKGLIQLAGDLAGTASSPSIAAGAVTAGKLASDVTTTFDARYAPVTEAVNIVAASGATLTIPAPTTATIHNVTLTANCTLTFPTAAAGVSFTLRLLQDATGSRTVTWPASVKWPGGVAPILTTTAARQDILSFLCIDGSTWLGFLSGLDVR